VRLTPTGELPEAPTAGPDIEAREALRRLYAILDGVGVQDRSLFVSRFLEKMEIAEVAIAHGLSYGTAKRHVARAIARISRRMERDPMLVKYLDATIHQRDDSDDADLRTPRAERRDWRGGTDDDKEQT
jgi:RNA polymerase sigma-70 factor (ECF subfamily)